MYLRLVQSRFKPEFLDRIKKIYDEKILSALQHTRGCLCACLIQNEVEKDEGLSITLWDSRQHAEDYVKSGLFRQLLDQLKPYLMDSSEWKIQLSEDLKLEYQPVPEEPTVSSYTTLAGKDRIISLKNKTVQMHLRILRIKVKENKMDELKLIYEQHILPQLQSVEGFHYGHLSENTEQSNEAISFTLWQSKEDAERYEASGLYRDFMNQTKHTFSELYQWKMTLDKSTHRKMVTSEDAEVVTYTLVSGRSFDRE